MNNNFNQDWRKSFILKANESRLREYKENIHRYELAKKWEQERKEKEEAERQRKLELARREEEETRRLAEEQKKKQQAQAVKTPDKNIKLPELKQPELKQPEIKQSSAQKPAQKPAQEPQQAPEKSSLLEGGPIGASVELLLSAPKFAQSREERDKNFKYRVQREADATFDQELAELEDQKRIVKAQYEQAKRNQMRRFLSAHMQDSDLESRIYTNKIKDIDSKIQDILKKKDRYITLMTQLTDSRQLFSSQLSNVISESDAFLDMQSRLDKAVETAKADKDKEVVSLFGMNIILPTNGKYRNSAKQALFQKQKEYELGTQFQNLVSYLDHLGYLPESIDKFPKLYQDIARKAFTKDGKLLLEDQDFRDEFNVGLITNPDEFSKLSNIAKNTTGKDITFDDKSLLRKKDQIQVMKDYVEMLINEGAREAVMGGYGYIQPKELVEQEKSLSAAQSILERAERYKTINRRIAENEKLPFTSLATGATAFKEFFWDDWKNTYLFDTDNLRNIGAIYDAAKKVELGQELTTSEKMLLDAKSIEDIYQGAFGDYERDNDAYKWSKIAAESLKFMAEFIATSGTSAYLQGTAKGVTKAASKALTRAALRNVEKRGANVATKMLLLSAKKIAPNAIGATSRLAADATYAAFLTNTLGLPKTLLDAAEASTPGITTSQDVFGNAIAESVENKKSFGEALLDSEKRNWIENFSEMMGEWGIGKGLAMVGKKIPKLGKFLTEIETGFQKGIERDIRKTALNYMRKGVLESNSLLSNSALRRIVPALKNVFNRRTLKAGQFHGMFGEVSEEYYGLILQHMMGVQDDPDKSLWQDIQDQTKDIWGGIAVSTGILGAFGMASSIRSQVKFDKATRNLTEAFGEDSATEIRKALAFSDPHLFITTLGKLLKEFGRGEVRGKYQTVKDLVTEAGIDRKTALAEYANALLELRGAIYGEDVVNRMIGENDRKLQLEAKERGYSEASYRRVAAMEPVVATLANDVKSIQLPETNEEGSTIVRSYKDALELYEQQGGDIVSTLRLLEDDNVSDEDLSKVVAYHNAVQYHEGINLRLNDLVKERVDNARRTVARMGNNAHRTLVRLFKNETKEDGTPILENEKNPNSKQKQKSLFVVRGIVDGAPVVVPDAGAAHIRTIAGSDEVDTAPGAYEKNDNGKILVSDASGTLRYINRSELEGWHIDNEQYDIAALQDQRENDIYDQEQGFLDNVYQQLNTTPLLGQRVQIGDKFLTVLDTDAYNGITYAISNDDGSDSRIYTASNTKELKDVIERQRAQETKEITKWFSDSAESMVSNRRKSQEERRKRIEKSLQDTWESRDTEDTIDTQKIREEREAKEAEEREEATRKGEALQKVWESRDTDDTIDTQKIREEQEQAEAQQKSEALQSVWESRDFDSTIDTRKIAEEREARERAEQQQREREEHERQREQYYQFWEDVNEDEEEEYDEEPPYRMSDDELKQHVQDREQYYNHWENDINEEDQEEYDDEPAYKMSDAEREQHAQDRERYYNRWENDINEEDVEEYEEEPLKKTYSTPTMLIKTPSSEVLEELNRLFPKKTGNAQKDAYAALVRDIEKAAEEKQDQATGFHYFIQTAEGLQLYRRVHSVKPDQWDEVKKNKEAEERAKVYRDRLQKVYEDSGRSIDAIEKEINTILGEIEADLPTKTGKGKERWEYYNELTMRELKFSLGWKDDISNSLYIEYLRTHNNPLDVSECLDALSSILGKNSPNPSVISGNIYDTIARLVMDSRNRGRIDYNDPRLTMYFYGQKVHISDLQLWPENTKTKENWAQKPFITKEAFEAIQDQLLKIKEYYEKTLGWQLCTDPYTLHGTLLVDGKAVKIAGETDCVAVDEAGHRHIVDFKTYGIHSHIYYGDLDQYFKHLPVGGDEKIDTFSTGVDHAMQMYLYKMLAVQMQNPMDSSETLLFGIEKQQDGNGGMVIAIDDKNVSKSKLLVEDEDTGELVPNRKNLDGFGTEMLHEVYVRFRERVKQFTKDSLEKAKSRLASMRIELQGEYVDSLDPSIVQMVQDCNGITQQLLDKTVPDDDDARTAATKEVNDHIQRIENLIKQLEELSLDYLRKVQEEGTAKKFFEDFYPQSSRRDIEQLVFTQWEEDYTIAYININELPLDEIEGEELQNYFNALLRMQIILNHAAAVGAISPANFLKIQSHIEYQKLNLLQPKGLVETFEKLVAENAFPIEESEIQVDEKRSSLEITGMSDKAGPNSVEASRSQFGTPLEQVLSNSDFIDAAEFYAVRIGVSENGYPKFGIIVRYQTEKGVEEFSPVEMNVAHNDDGLLPNAKQLYSDLCERTKEHSDDKPVLVKLKNVKISRTFGDIKNSSEHVISSEEMQTLTGKSLAELQYGGESEDIGLTKTQKIGNRVYVVAAAPEQGSRKKKVLYVYNSKNSETKPVPGVVVLLYTPGYEEFADRDLKASQKRVPINLNSQNFDNDTAWLIANILSGQHCDFEDGDTMLDILGKPFKQGNKIYPFSNQDVLLLFISWQNHNRKGKKLHIHLETASDGKVYIVGVLNGISQINPDTGELGTFRKGWDLSTEAADFVDFLLKNVRMQLFDKFMSERFRDSDIGKAATSWFDEHEDEDEIHFGNSPIKINFEEDIASNMNGIGWCIKNGMLRTAFSHLERPLISIDEVDAIDDQLPPKTPPASPTNGSNLEESPDQVSSWESGFAEQNGAVDSLLNLFGSRKDNYSSVLPFAEPEFFIDEAEARARIAEILGDVPVTFQDEIFGVVQNGLVVAQCYKDVIKMSRRSARGTEYHEAFHRVLELLVSEKVRNRAYKAYKRKFGKDLTDVEIAERAADEFWWYKENMPIKKWSWNFRELLGIFKQWYDFFTKIGSFDLYRLYSSASNGKFRGKQPTPEALARWKNLTKENGGFLASTYSLNGVDYKHIMNHKEYDAVVQTIKSIALEDSTYKDLGNIQITAGNVGDIKLTTDRIVKAPAFVGILTSGTFSQEAKDKLLDVMGYKRGFDKNNKPILVKIDDRGQRVIDAVSRELKKMEQTAFSEEKALQKQKSKGLKPSDTNEEALTAEHEGDTDENDLTQEGEFGVFEKISADYDPITRASQRVKFFFATTQDMEYITVMVDGQLQRIPRLKLNAAGLPQLMDYKTAWGIIVNRTYFCRSQKELYDRLRQLSMEDAFYKALFIRYRNLLVAAYGNEKGEFIDKATGEFLPVKNENAAGTLWELTSVMCHAKVPPMVIESVQNDKTQEQQIRVMSASMEYTVRETRKNWTAALASGEGKYIGKNENGVYFIKHGHTSDEIKEIAYWFRRFTNLLSTTSKYPVTGTMTVHPRYHEYENGVIKDEVKQSKEVSGDEIKSNELYLHALCQEFIEKLNDLGIGFTMDDFMFLLNNQYGHTDPKENTLLKRLLRFATANAEYINSTFYRHIEDIADITSLDYKRHIEQMWSNYKRSDYHSAFIDVLSKARYYRICNEHMLSYLTIGGKKQYAMLEHNFITDRVDELRNPNSKKMQDLTKDKYYTYGARSGRKGSRVFEWINDPKHNLARTLIEFQSAPGMKTDAARSSGIEYLKFSEQEDVVAKYAMLANNGIIMPTMSDKTTYGCLYMGEAFGAFGIDWTLKIDTAEEGGHTSAIRKFLGGSYKVGKLTIKGRLEVFLLFNNDVLDLFIKYAECEYRSAKYQLEQYQKLSDAEKVENFYGRKVKVVINGKKETRTIIQGARLSTFSGVFDSAGNWISFNYLKAKDASGAERFVDEAELLRIANDNFFRLKDELKREKMRQILSHQVLKELDYLISLNMLEYNPSYGYKNKRLDAYKIRRMRYLLSSDNEIGDYLTAGVEHSDAVVAYVADMVSKAQMSHQESYRIFSGNLACYKWEYDENTGALKDLTKDFFKRTGGFVSTGQHNVPDIPGLPKKVVCAEMTNEIWESPFSEEFKDNALEQEFKKVLFDIYRESEEISIDSLDPTSKKYKAERIKKIHDDIDKLSGELLKKALFEKIVEARAKDLKGSGIYTESEILEHAKKQASSAIASIEHVIKRQYEALMEVNVNDGAAYVTDEFCEILLKAIGKWNDEISRAFKVLRGMPVKVKGKDKEEHDRVFTKQEMLDIAQAYRIIYTTVIGTQKYTAFGQRILKDGTAISYYDKPAFFPIFECMASGHMAAVLKKMKDQNIHLLKTSGSIKVGGTGAKPLGRKELDEWDANPLAYEQFSFNTYDQEFDEFRKQFNTDPKGKEYMPLGSQYQKVVLSLLQADTVIDVNGQEMNALQVRDEVMKCYLQIMEAGKEKHADKFYNSDGSLNIDAFVSILRKQLQDKDANDPLLDALSIQEYEVTDPKTGEKTTKRKFKIPVAALSSGTWIESIVASVINKDIIDVTSPGAAFYQRSAWASEGKMSDALRANVSSEDDWQHVINHGAPLQEKNEQGSMDIVLSIDYFDYLFRDQPSLVGQSFERKKEWLIKNGIISGFEKNEQTYVAREKDVFLLKDGTVVTVKEGDQYIGKEITARKWQDAKTSIVGYRIPTQAVSSIHAMRCVDVLPVVRDTIILPKEVTAVTGSDFDIDKFFISTKYYQEKIESGNQEVIDAIVLEFGFKDEKAMLEAFNEAKAKREKAEKEGNTDAIKEADEIINKVNTAMEQKVPDGDKITSGKRYSEYKRKALHLTDKYDPEEQKKKHWLNKLIDIQIALLQTNGNNLSALHGSIDVDTEPLKEMANEILNRDPLPDLEAFDSSSLRANVQSKMAFAIGKAGIGPYALNNNNHVFTMLYDIKFIKGKHPILDKLGLRDLSKKYDKDLHSIPQWISGLINAHVDVAKDPYIRRLGVNAYTYNLVSLLIRTGYGRSTFWFTSQPIMKLIYDAYDTAAGVYSQDETLSKYARTTNAVNNFFLDYVKSVTGTSVKSVEKGIQQIDTYIKGKYSHILDLYTLISAIMNTDQGVQVMRKMSTTPDKDLQEKYDIGFQDPIDYKDIQLAIAAANFQLQKAAQDLSTLVQYTKIDTKKQGKTVIEQKAYEASMKTLTDPKKSPFEHEGITKMINGSFIGPKTKDSIEAMRRLLSTQIFEATDGFDRLVTQVKKALNSSKTDEDFMTSISKMIVAKLKADYFFRGDDCYCVKRGIDPLSLVRSGQGSSIYALLTKIKAGVANPEDHRYDSIRDKNTGQCNNYLINSLITHIFVTEDELNHENMLPEDKAVTNIAEDDWLGAQFVKSLNLSEDAIKSADMQNAWLDLLNDSSNPDLLEFAEKLVVYAFMTSASSGGSFDLFKFVPPAWMSGECGRLNQTLDKNETFAAYIVLTLENLNSSENYPVFSDQELDEMILNFSYDDNIVKLQSQDRVDSFVTVSGVNKQTPLILGAVYGVDSEGAFSAYGDEYPAFIKVPTRNANVRSGQRRYDIYKCVAMGKTETDGKGNSARFPIYALVQPSGGVYREGQRIYALDLQKALNAKSNFRDYWRTELKELMDGIPNSHLFKDPADVFMELLGMQNSQEESVQKILESLEPLFNEFGDKFEYQTLSSLMEAAERNRAAQHAEFFPLYAQRQLDYTKRRSKANKEAVDFYKVSTDLHLEEVDSSYVPIQLNSAADVELLQNAFGKDIIAKIQLSPFHLEFYKKKFTVENGKQYFNVTITISIPNAKAKGWFELSANIKIGESKVSYTGDYSVRMNTYSTQMKNDTKNASVPLNTLNKTKMMQETLFLLPEGALISANESETISKGGIHMLNELEKYIFENKKGTKSAYVAKIGEKDAKSDDGSDIKVPIFRKSDIYKSLYVGNKASIDIQDYDKNAIPDFNAEAAKTDTTLTDDVKGLIRSQFAEKAKSAETYVSDQLLISEIVEQNESVRKALINSGNTRINIFSSQELNDALTAERLWLQNQQAAESTYQSCNI